MSPSRSAAEGARRDSHQKVKLFSVWLNGLLKPTDHVGQHGKDNREVRVSQSFELSMRLTFLNKESFRTSTYSG